MSIDSKLEALRDALGEAYPQYQVKLAGEGSAGSYRLNFLNKGDETLGRILMVSLEALDWPHPAEIVAYLQLHDTESGWVAKGANALFLNYDHMDGLRHS